MLSHPTGGEEGTRTCQAGSGPEGDARASCWKESHRHHEPSVRTFHPRIKKKGENQRSASVLPPAPDAEVTPRRGAGTRSRRALSGGADCAARDENARPSRRRGTGHQRHLLGASGWSSELDYELSPPFHKEQPLDHRLVPPSLQTTAGPPPGAEVGLCRLPCTPRSPRCVPAQLAPARAPREVCWVQPGGRQAHDSAGSLDPPRFCVKLGWACLSCEGPAGGCFGLAD